MYLAGSTIDHIWSHDHLWLNRPEFMPARQGSLERNHLIANADSLIEVASTRQTAIG